MKKLLQSLKTTNLRTWTLIAVILFLLSYIGCKETAPLPEPEVIIKVERDTAYKPGEVVVRERERFVKFDFSSRYGKITKSIEKSITQTGKFWLSQNYFEIDLTDPLTGNSLAGFAIVQNNELKQIGLLGYATATDSIITRVDTVTITVDSTTTIREYMKPKVKFLMGGGLGYNFNTQLPEFMLSVAIKDKQDRVYSLSSTVLNPTVMASVLVPIVFKKRNDIPKVF